jgi:ribonuclease P protein subunit POP4
MSRSERNILIHELIGLECEVISAKNKSLVGISGKILDETQKTLVIGDERKRVAKQDAKFCLKIGSKAITVDGSFLVARPEDRIKKKFKKW